jgi:hypothetical protein
MKIVMMMTLLIGSIFAASFQPPSKMYNASGAVVDMVVADQKLYAATDASSVDVFDLKSAKIVKKITVSKITDFMDDIATKKMNFREQVSFSKFSNFALNEKKSEVVVADESGDLKIHNTKDGKLIKTLAGQNLDNVFQVDYKNGIIATAGQDRRVVVYNTTFNSAYYKTAPFLIYGVGLSPSGKLVAYASDEQNNVTVFKTSGKSTVGHYSGNKMTLSKIIFINEKEFLVSSDDKTINLYKIK